MSDPKQVPHPPSPQNPSDGPESPGIPKTTEAREPADGPGHGGDFSVEVNDEADESPAANI